MHKNNKTVSRTSPKSGNRGCLCKDNTYSKKCCDGSMQAQGIGNITKISYMFKSLFNMAKKKKVAEKPMEMAQEPMEVIVEQPIIEKVEVKEEKQQDGVRTIVSHNG